MFPYSIRLVSRRTKPILHRPSTVRQFPLRLFEQAPFLGIVGRFIGRGRTRGHNPLSFPGLRVDLRDSHRFPYVAKRALHHNAFLGLAVDQSNASLFFGMKHEIIDRRR